MNSKPARPFTLVLGPADTHLPVALCRHLGQVGDLQFEDLPVETMHADPEGTASHVTAAIRRGRPTRVILVLPTTKSAGLPEGTLSEEVMAEVAAQLPETVTIPRRPTAARPDEDGEPVRHVPDETDPDTRDPHGPDSDFPPYCLVGSAVVLSDQQVLRGPLQHIVELISAA